MARTESKSIQVHPSDEQAQIDLMQKFHWNLISSQEIKSVDNSLERRGDSLYNVRHTEHYIKLVFSRDLDLPNLQKLKALDNEYFSQPFPNDPPLIPLGTFGLILLIGLILFYGVGLVLFGVYLFVEYLPKKEKYSEIRISSKNKQNEILLELEKYG